MIFFFLTPYFFFFLFAAACCSLLAACCHRCVKCPTSYHLNCIPPDARYHELALLCEAHLEVRVITL